MIDTIQHEYVDSTIANNHKVIDCKTCGFWHVFPIPGKEELNRYYQEVYYQSGKEHGDMKDKNEDPDGYYRIKYFDKLANLNQLLSKNASKSILDLGAGFGDFLAFMKGQGWVVGGVEPAAECLRASRHKDCNVIHGNLEDLDKIKIGKYSVITLNTVLEHYPHPENLLVYIRENFMDEHTILHIEVPNDFSIMQEMVRSVCNPRRYWLCPLGHLNYWTHETLSKFVTRLGFKIEIMESTFPLEMMAVLGDDYITYPDKGRAIHMRRVEFEKKIYSEGKADLKRELYQKFAKIGIGREVLLYLRKR